MTSPTSDECRRLAEQARQWAEEETDTSARKDLNLIALAWLLLANSHQSFEALKAPLKDEKAG
jgi:hypothetical protein